MRRLILLLLLPLFGYSQTRQSGSISFTPQWNYKISGSDTTWQFGNTLMSPQQFPFILTKWQSDQRYAPISGGGYVPTSRTITALYGLIGGGDLTTNRSFIVDTANIVTKTYGTRWLTQTSAASTYQPLLGFTAENIANKTATQSSSTTTYPNWLGVTNYVSGLSSVYQPLNAKLTSISALANSAGVLTNDGSGGFSYVAPSMGTVTSITPGYGFTSSTPITTSGTMTIDTTKLLTVTGAANNTATLYRKTLQSTYTKIWDGTRGIKIGGSSLFGGGMIWDASVGTPNDTNFSLMTQSGSTTLNTTGNMYFGVLGTSYGELNTTGFSIDGVLEATSYPAGTAGTDRILVQGTTGGNFGSPVKSIAANYYQAALSGTGILSFSGTTPTYLSSSGSGNVARVASPTFTGTLGAAAIAASGAISTTQALEAGIAFGGTGFNILNFNAGAGAFTNSTNVFNTLGGYDTYFSASVNPGVQRSIKIGGSSGFYGGNIYGLIFTNGTNSLPASLELGQSMITTIANGGSVSLAGNLTPSTDNTIDLGSAALKFANIYATTATANSNNNKVATTAYTDGAITTLKTTTPQIVASYPITTRTSVGALISYVAPVDGMYKVDMSIIITSIVTNTLQASVTYTDTQGNVRTLTGNTYSTNAFTVTWGGMGIVSGANLLCKAGTTVTVSITNPVSGGSNTFDISSKITYMP